MYKKGVNGTSVDDVLSASGTGKSQFYHYFASKDALVKELLRFHLEALPAAKETLLTGLDTVAGVEAWLDQIQADHAAGLYQEGCPIGNLASELAGQNEELRVDLQSTFAHWEQRLTEGLKAMVGRGELRSTSAPEELAVFWVAAIEGALLLAKTNRSGSPLAATIAQVKGQLHGLTMGAEAVDRAQKAPEKKPGKPAPLKRVSRPLSFCP